MKFFINIKHTFTNLIPKNEKSFKTKMSEIHKNNDTCEENLVLSFNQTYKELDDDAMPDESKLCQITHCTQWDNMSLLKH